ncbi:MAG: TIGR02444 family protein [Parvularculaceae bacterium]
MTAAPSDSIAEEFWSWSVGRYEDDRVARRLIALQDEFGLDVNILLWCGWAAERFREIPDLAVRKAVDLTARWTREVTGPLRAARHALKTPPPRASIEAAAALREAVKNAELAAERIEQEILASLAGAALTPADEQVNSLARLRRNLVTYAAIAGAQRRKGFSVVLLDELARALLPDADRFDADPRSPQ